MISGGAGGPPSIKSPGHAGAAAMALFVMFLVVIGSIVLTQDAASAFGTIDGAGQHREHERITRAALACAQGKRSTGDCFEPMSMDQLAGHGRAFGAVGAPDSDEISDPAAHCDSADFLRGNYPRTREQASTGLEACVSHLRARFHEGVDSAEGLLDEQDRIVADEAHLDADCKFFGTAREPVKCAAIEGLGRALHGAQDFYSHSNWADEADPSRPIGADNPPGLDLPGPSPILDLRGHAAIGVAPDLTTGCYVLQDRVPGVGDCTARITHAGLNKDNGIIDPVTGATSGPTTPRGLVKQNFAKAVAAAIAETRRQWRDFRSELAIRYGPARASVMICAVTRDDPADDCRGRQTGAAIGWVVDPVVLSPVVAVLAAVALLFAYRRHRRA
jgi:hypothetical protein